MAKKAASSGKIRKTRTALPYMQLKLLHCYDLHLQNALSLEFIQLECALTMQRCSQVQKLILNHELIDNYETNQIANCRMHSENPYKSAECKARVQKLKNQ